MNENSSKYMMSEQEIIERLQQIGFKSREIRTVMADVAQVVMAKVAEAYLPKVSTEERATLRSLSREELQKYLSSHSGSLPSFTRSDFERIHDGVWADYFRSVK